MQQQKYHVIILAGSRPGGEPFAHAAGKTQKIFLKVGGKTILTHVLEALLNWPQTASLTLNIPKNSPWQTEDPSAAKLIKAHNITLAGTKNTPCTSLLSALEALTPALARSEPVLIVTADAPLLNHGILAELTQQNTPTADFIAGVARVNIVEEAYPRVKRTRIRLRDGAIGGCNLFILNNTRALGAIAFWRTLENNRKKPWRLAASFKMLVLYVFGLLSATQALKELAKKTKCTLKFAYLTNPHAAIDVDKSEDLTLVRHIFETELAPPPKKTKIKKQK